MTIPSSQDGDTNEEMLLVCPSYGERRISVKQSSILVPCAWKTLGISVYNTVGRHLFLY